MEVHAAATVEEVSGQAAEFVARAATTAIRARGRFSMALSGGSTPWKMLKRLRSLTLPWHRVHIFQVDERVAPDGDPARNLTHIQSQLLDHIDIPAENVHAMPVTVADLLDGTQAYQAELETWAGNPAVLDMVHLGMGGDGHTASLLPGDDALSVSDRDVAITGVYQGHHRMTLTFPALNRARQILWLIMGEDKLPMVTRILQADSTIPAGCVDQERAILFTDIRSLSDD